MREETLGRKREVERRVKENKRKKIMKGTGEGERREGREGRGT